jgi:hypothetical protein
MNHAAKRTIRDYWCKPLIRFLHENLRQKLTYLGLPAPDAHDIMCWIDYLDHVIAFQCRDYPKPSSVDQSKEAVQKLERKLLELERQGKLESFALYDGYIEEVLIKEKDTVGKDFSQNQIVTIYNLDFCNSITVPLYYYDQKHNRREAYKSEAIKKLLEIQRKISVSNNGAKFVMFLTVHSDFFHSEKERFSQQEQDVQLRKYISKVARLSKTERDLRTLKTYVYQILKSLFCASEFSPEFLPAIYYKGASSQGQENWLVHFTIIGTHNRNPSTIAPCLQEPMTFIGQKFLDIKGNTFCSRNTDGFNENNAHNNSIDAFKNSAVYKQIWLK